MPWSYPHLENGLVEALMVFDRGRLAQQPASCNVANRVVRAAGDELIRMGRRSSSRARRHWNAITPAARAMRAYPGWVSMRFEAQAGMTVTLDRCVDAGDSQPGGKPSHARSIKRSISWRWSGAGFQYGLATARSAATAIPAFGIPMSLSARGAFTSRPSS
jgi:hypothetical protein